MKRVFFLIALFSCQPNLFALENSFVSVAVKSKDDIYKFALKGSKDPKNRLKDLAELIFHYIQFKNNILMMAWREKENDATLELSLEWYETSYPKNGRDYLIYVHGLPEKATPINLSDPVVYIEQIHKKLQTVFEGIAAIDHDYAYFNFQNDLLKKVTFLNKFKEFVKETQFNFKEIIDTEKTLIKGNSYEVNQLLWHAEDTFLRDFFLDIKIRNPDYWNVSFCVSANDSVFRLHLEIKNPKLKYYDEHLFWHLWLPRFSLRNTRIIEEQNDKLEKYRKKIEMLNNERLVLQKQLDIMHRERIKMLQQPSSIPTCIALINQWAK